MLGMYDRNSKLDERKQRILKAIVHEHVETAEPVGSGALLLHYDFGVRSATIRNEMAEMSEMGYLKQPHTSAGRVPSDLGYRFYVDKLMGEVSLPESDDLSAKEHLSEVEAELERIIARTCRILTGLTRYTSVATQPVSIGTVISHIGISKLAGRKLLLLVVCSDGRVQHRLLDVRREVCDRDVELASNQLAKKFSGATLESIRAASKVGQRASVTPEPTLFESAVEVLNQIIDSLSDVEADVHVEGTNYILRQPEFKDVSRLENLLAILEERSTLYQFLTRAMLEQDVTVVIGQENPFDGMRETSFVAAKYKIGERTAGMIGVVGPTRMDYRRAVAAVEAVSKSMSDLLTLISLS